MGLIGLLSTSLMLSSFFYSWSAWKLDAKVRFGWAENDASTAFAFANMGQQFAIHLGLFYDTQGPFQSFSIAAALKAAGQFGMMACCSLSSVPSWLFGLCFLLDTQGTALTIVVAQKEAQKASKPSRRGTSASILTGAFGAGAIVWVRLYDRVFSPNLESILLFGGVASSASLLLCALVVPYLVQACAASTGVPVKKATTTSRSHEGDEVVSTSTKLRKIVFSKDFGGFFAYSSITWGIPLVWIANAASFSTAAGLLNGAAIRSGFFTASLVGRIVAGPITDMVVLPMEFWLLSTMAIMLFAAFGMLVTAGAAMYPLACATGFAFGATTTLGTLHCQSLDPSLFGTLYGICKVGVMAASNAWTFLAGMSAQWNTPSGMSSCVGPECYRLCWLSMLGVSFVLSPAYVAWGMRAAVRAYR